MPDCVGHVRLQQLEIDASLLPARLDATVDVTNLMEQEYRPVVSKEGRGMSWPKRRERFKVGWRSISSCPVSFSVQLRGYGTSAMVVRANAVLRPIISSTVAWQL